jgi:hypothetical protein
MDYATPLSIIALAGLIHASFQAGVSMILLLNGHSLIAKHSSRRTLGLAASFSGGAFVMTMLIVSFIAFAATRMWPQGLPIWLWNITFSLLLGLGTVVWACYYRHNCDGTTLWLPRAMARFLSDRTKATHDGAEAFSLGLTAVLAEFLFVVPTAMAAALTMTLLPASWQGPGVLLYSLLASLGLGIVVVLLGGGHHIGTIQRWRESHKRFLQFVAGAGLIILGFFIYSNYVLMPVLNGGM